MSAESPGAVFRNRRALYLRLSAAFLSLLFLSSVFVLWSFFRVWRDLQAESVQRANWHVATELSRALQPLLAPRIEYIELAQRAAQLGAIHPTASIVLLNREGAVLELLPHHFPLARAEIEVAPLEHFLAQGKPEARAIFGDDPVSHTDRGVFSVARIDVGGEQGYLYVFFRSFSDNVSATLGAASAAGRAVLVQTVVFTIAAALLGLWLFNRLTRRFYRIIGTVQAWRSGSLAARVEDRGTDELGYLAESLNQMTATIRTNIEELERKDQLRRELIASVSHDLRGPVAVVKGYLDDLLVRISELDEDARFDRLEGIARGVRSLNELIVALFELAKFEAKEVEPRLEPFPLVARCRELLRGYDALASERGIALRCESAECEVVVRADPVLFDRVIANLVGNALRFTPAGGAVTIDVAANGMVASVAVTDTGAGIPAGDIERIFEKFHRGDESTGDGGAGLGLAIVRRILELHGSEITVQSVVGKGTSFRFALSRAPTPA